jgi:hypothetical protein
MSASPIQIDGHATISPNGFAELKGSCTLRLPYLAPDSSINAFTFEFLTIHHRPPPKITFGIEAPKPIPECTFDYFDLLSEIRGSGVVTYQPISYDCLVISVHLLWNPEDTLLAVYCQDYVKHSPAIAVDKSTIRYFLNVRQLGTSTLFTPLLWNYDTSLFAFYPTLMPALWAPTPAPTQIRGFHIGGNSMLRSVYGEHPQARFPESPLRSYFEVQMRSSGDPDGGGHETGLFVGFVSEPHALAEKCPGYTKKSIGFLSHPSTFLIGSRSCRLPGVQIATGNTVGVGIRHNGSVLMTLNGQECHIEDDQEEIQWAENVPVVTTSFVGEEVLVNFGQLPFKAPEVRPPRGWCIEAGRFVPEFFEKGPPPECHLLHFFPYVGYATDAGALFIEAFVGPKSLRAARFEVTLLRLASGGVVALGFSSGDFHVGHHVGWNRKTIGVHSDDGVCYREGTGSAPLFDPQIIQDGKTLGISIKDGTITYSVNKEIYPVGSDWNLPPIPTVTCHRPCQLVFNFGECQFVIDSPPATHGQTVRLFNGVQVVMTNDHLDAYGVQPGDFIETRDLAFRGTFIGELNGRLYVNAHGLDGAFPFAENDPLEFKRLVRIVWRQHGPLRSLVLTSEGLHRVDLDRGQGTRIYATRNGIATLLGISQTGEYIMRPVVDLFNNTPCFTLTEPPVNILALIPDVMPLHDTERVTLLDVVDDSTGKIVLVLGRTRDACVVWNNVKVEEVQLGANIFFRFLGYHFKDFATSSVGWTIVNVGTQPGGNAFLANYQGTRGSVFCQTGVMQKSYGARGFQPVPPIATLLLRTLNESFMLKLRHMVCQTAPKEPTAPGLVLRVDEVRPETPKRPLITQVEAQRMRFRPPLSD